MTECPYKPSECLSSQGPFHSGERKAEGKFCPLMAARQVFSTSQTMWSPLWAGTGCARELPARQVALPCPCPRTRPLRQGELLAGHRSKASSGEARSWRTDPCPFSWGHRWQCLAGHEKQGTSGCFATRSLVRNGANKINCKLKHWSELDSKGRYGPSASKH